MPLIKCNPAHNVDCYVSVHSVQNARAIRAERGDVPAGEAAQPADGLHVLRAPDHGVPEQHGAPLPRQRHVCIPATVKERL